MVTRENERRPPFNAPVRAYALAEWALWPLRLFLGVTFVYAGLQKLANPNFFLKKSPNSIYAQLAAAARTSPVHAVLAHLTGLSYPIGVTIAYGELAIGLGVLFGLWTRIAATGGAILSFSLFLTVSFHSSPYFTGADIVFLFAWFPFIIAGSSSRLSIDAWVAQYAAKKEGVSAPRYVALDFTTVRRLCGHLTEDLCGARGGLACDAAVCPVLLGTDAPTATPVQIQSYDRRKVVVGAVATASAAAAAVILGSTVAATGKLIGNAPPPTSSASLGGETTTTGATGGTSPYSGTLLGAAAQVKEGAPATFTIASSGDPGIVIREKNNEFVAYDTVCPHMGCTVGYSASADLLVCPCHGSEFTVSTGAVVRGPSPRGLTKLDVVEEPDGNLYLQ